MAFARVQGSALVLVGNAPTAVISMPTTPVVGNSLIVFANQWAGGPSVPSVIDNYGNEWVSDPLLTAINATNNRTAILYCPIIKTSGAGFQITLSGNPAWWVAQAIEISGGGTGIGIDRSATATGNSAAPAVPALAALVSPDTFQAACFCLVQSQSAITVVVASPVWTQEMEYLSTSYQPGEGDSRIVTGGTGTTPSVSWTCNAANAWAAVLVAFAPNKVLALQDQRTSQVAAAVASTQNVGLRGSQVVGVVATVGGAPPSIARTSQLTIETLVLPVPKSRVSQIAIEALILPASTSRVSQMVVETLNMPPSISRVSQIAIEHLKVNTDVASTDVGWVWLGGGGSNIWVE